MDMLEAQKRTLLGISSSCHMLSSLQQALPETCWRNHKIALMSSFMFNDE